MSGEQLKEILKERRIVLAELASTIGYSRQNFNSKLSAKDLGVSFLIDVAKGVNISLYELLGMSESTDSAQESRLVAENYELLKENRQLRQRLEKLEKKYVQTEEINFSVNEPSVEHSKEKPKKKS